MSLEDSARKEASVFGIGVSPGIVIGRALLVEPGVCVKRLHIESGEVTTEQERFRRGVAATEESLRQVRDQFAAVISEYAPIIDTHILMLRDSMIFDQALSLIAEEKINAEWALDQVLGRVEQVFSRIEDSYIRERFLDVRQVVHRILRELGGSEKIPEEIDEGVILVSRDFSPEDILQMRGRAGFLAEMGGQTSHSTIVARTLGIPAVVGLVGATRQIVSGDLVILDGSSGMVAINPQAELLDRYRQRQRQHERYSREMSRYAHLRSETADGLLVRVEANLEIADEVGQVLQYGAAGIGLFRSEYLYWDRKGFPDEEILFASYKKLLEKVAPFPVTIRTLDIGGDKKLSVRCGQIKESRCNTEANPALGLRAIRFCLREPALFETQLRALLRASAFGTMRILFPMISSYCELAEVKKIVDGVKEDLLENGIAFDRNVELGVMIEVPSAVAIADTLAKEVDFFSIGTNDLIQYALAIDRRNEQVAHMYEPLHPAVLRMIGQVVQAGHRAGIEVGICGEMAGSEAYLPVLLGLGLDSLSMHPLAIPHIKRMIRHSSAEEVESLAAHLLTCVSALEVRKSLHEYLPCHYPFLAEA